MTTVRVLAIFVVVFGGAVSACPDDKREAHTNEFLNHLLPGHDKGVMRSLVHHFLGNVHIQPIHACAHGEHAAGYLLTVRGGAAGASQNPPADDVQTREDNGPLSVNSTTDQIESTQSPPTESAQTNTESAQTTTESPHVDNRPTNINDIWSMVLPGHGEGFRNLVRKILHNVQMYPIYACDNGDLTVMITFNGVKIVPPFKGVPPFQNLLDPMSPIVSKRMKQSETGQYHDILDVLGKK